MAKARRWVRPRVGFPVGPPAGLWEGEKEMGHGVRPVPRREGRAPGLWARNEREGEEFFCFFSKFYFKSIFKPFKKHLKLF